MGHPLNAEPAFVFHACRRGKEHDVVRVVVWRNDSGISFFSGGGKTSSVNTVESAHRSLIREFPGVSTTELYDKLSDL